MTIDLDLGNHSKILILFHIYEINLLGLFQQFPHAILGVRCQLFFLSPTATNL